MKEAAQDVEVRLPDAVRALAERLGCNGVEPMQRVALRQTGVMRQDASAKWMRFKAQQTIETATCAFDWRARAGPFNSMHVRDAFDGVDGDLSVRLLGVMQIAGAAPSPELNRGELLRYLAELPWAPDALLLNPALSWRCESERELWVSATSGETSGEIRLTLGEDGLVAEAFAEGRPRSIDGGFVITPWRGTFSEYAMTNGRMIPRSAEVAWVGERGVELVWSGRILNCGAG